MEKVESILAAKKPKAIQLSILRGRIMQVYVLSQYFDFKTEYESDNKWVVVGVTASYEVALKWYDGSKTLIVEDENKKQYFVNVQNMPPHDFCGHNYIGVVMQKKSWEVFEVDDLITPSRDG